MWLFFLAGLIFAMVLLGGVTRLTGSGLSITEWRPITGVIPPLTPEAWEEAFSRYRQIPQYMLLNAQMTLDGFKTIYLWEWGHRFFGRFIGLVFAIPCAVFLLTRQVWGRLAFSILGLGLLGGLQGLIGWIMVKSGFAPGHSAVAPTRLMAHLLMAHLLCGVSVALGVSLSGAHIKGASRVPGVRLLLWGLLILLMAQIALGALVAGLKAGLTYNTWPLMDGRFLPLWEDFARQSPWWLNGVGNPLAVQFLHRMGAYTVVMGSAGLAAYAFVKAPYSPLFKWIFRLFILFVIQMVVGIFTLIFQVPLWAGLLHQGLALLGVIWTVTILVRVEKRPLRL
jgi:cytochrome c oxidase assembly protein subunit 15